MSNNNNIDRREKNTHDRKKVLKNFKFKGINTAAAVCTALLAAATGFALTGNDEAALTARLTAEGESVITQLPPKEYNVKIVVDGKNYAVRSSGTVQDAISAAGIEVSEDDLMNIGLSEPLNANTNIVINRVDIIEEVQVEVLHYATKYKEDDSLLAGYSETIVDGEEGEVETTLRSVYVDGELVSSAVIDTDVTEPVDQVVVVGTKEEEPEPEPVVYTAPAAEAPQTATASADVPLDANGVPLEYSSILTGKSCAYTAAPGALTASGRAAQVGVVAVDPDIIPYGTELYIAASDGSGVYGYAVAADTGGALLDGRILVDLFMNSTAECYEWGSREVNIYILD